MSTPTTNPSPSRFAVKRPRRALAMFGAAVTLAAGLAAYGFSPAGAATQGQAARATATTTTFPFKLIASPGIAKCLPHARGAAWITPVRSMTS